MKKILSIDGGGIRGVIPGKVLVALEKKLQERHRPDARLADYFDFFAGTSTGGILSCILLCPSKDDPTKARFTAQEAVDLYIENGSTIFQTNFLRDAVTLKGMADERYDAKYLEACLEKYFGDTKLSELLKPCIIPAYDIEKRHAHFFTQHDARKKGESHDFLVRDVCRATSAAPTYFEAANIPSLSGLHYGLVDGGVFANNPALCAYSEVRGAKDDPTVDKMLIVSLGTASENKPYPYAEMKNNGAVGWIQPLIDIMMSGASETTDYHLGKMFSARKREEYYLRIQPSSIGRATYEMDNASDENIKALIEVGIETAQNCEEMDAIVQILIDDYQKDPVIF